MPFTRRSLLRHAALASVAGASGLSPLLLTGCNEHYGFAHGIRIFFEGAWVFYADPFNPDLLRAVAIDPAEFIPTPVPGQAPQSPMKISHIFPFGRWTNDPDWDNNNGNLLGNLDAYQGSTLVPYPLTVTGTQSAACRVDDLFAATDSSSRMTYLKNPARTYKPDCTHAGLRVISIPFPTRIIPAAFRTDADINDSANRLHQHGNSKDTGIATTHIFEYKGANMLTFTPPGNSGKSGTPITMTGGTDSRSDFHFHTVPAPPPPTAKYLPPDGHGIMMFAQLLNFIDPKLPSDLCLEASDCSTARIAKGSLVPTSIPDWELEIEPPPANCPRLVNLATCGSGSIGVGDGGCC